MLRDIAAQVMGIIVVALVGTVATGVWRWIDRFTNAPIMEERINTGSDRFFGEEHAKRIASGGRITFEDW